jgi:hypothetical protein
MKETIAIQFGTFLDEDKFAEAQQLLHPNCEYLINGETLIGSQTIMDLYEKNSKEGHQKFDKLVWGKCRIETIDQDHYYVHFSDYLKHKGIEHTYRCKQKLTINDEQKITQILHCEIPEERKKLDAFYKQVGL